MKWYAGSDHAGYKLKRRLIKTLRALGDEVLDVGTDAEESVDYPDFGAKVARRVAVHQGEALGLLVCGTGIGISIAANKINGARAAVVTDTFTAQAARAHNDANIIALGARVTGPGVAEQAVKVFRETPFEGGRHQRRVDKIGQLEHHPHPAKPAPGTEADAPAGDQRKAEPGGAAD
ncbi:MAG TPA: ribose 5-phosphate isomerase B [Kofleriaceae bacterium]|nr:ribose 5-phosphate isomerase B [Kofleriaceae bacterium]